MGLYELFKDNFVGELSDSEHQELAKFASLLITAKAKQDVGSMESLLKQAADEIYDFEDFNNLAGLIALCKSQEVSGLDKVASNSDRFFKALDIVGKGALIAGTAAPFAAMMMKKRRDNKAYTNSFNSLMQEHPNLREPSAMGQTRRNFEALRTFAPDVAKNSLVAGNVLQRMHRMGPAMMDINMVNELTGAQKAIGDYQDKSRGPSMQGSLDRVNSTVNTLMPKIETTADKAKREAEQSVDLDYQTQAFRDKGEPLGRARASAVVTVADNKLDRAKMQMQLDQQIREKLKSQDPNRAAKQS